jgi:hypothetical protein
MGLDMYAYRTSVKLSKSVDFANEIEWGTATEFAYWRKHPNLHGWMENLYYKKGGESEFNCVPVELVAEDLDRLEKDIKAGNLPHTGGFFFGNSDGSNEETKKDLEFVNTARQAILEGDRVFYDSWW